MSEQDRDLIEPYAVQETFVDGWDDFRIENGILSCAGYRLQPAGNPGREPYKVVVIRMLMRLSDVPQMQTNCRVALAKAQCSTAQTEWTGRFEHH